MGRFGAVYRDPAVMDVHGFTPLMTCLTSRLIRWPGLKRDSRMSPPRCGGAAEAVGQAEPQQAGGHSAR